MIKDIRGVPDPLHPEDPPNVVHLRTALRTGLQGLGIVRLLEILAELCSDEGITQKEVWEDKKKYDYWRVVSKIVNETRRVIRGIKQ